MRTFDLEELKQIVEIAMDQEVPELSLDVDLYADLGMDSMGAVAMVVEIQRRFQVRLPDERVPDLRTPRLLLGAINDQLANVQPRADAA